ncbi:two-component system sensor histidine kinase CreC [Rhodoferax sp.]|uniref:two-component system sensor histidine kinase CreC n=1 Tax=Rhodoferax sp. TaxID=50421 RepID=UPI0027782861|nr:two-component system sensor histidine kinase CreC [Rhodoferax sp.]
MSKRNRIFVGILLIYAAGVAFFLYRVVIDLDPRYRESAEESLVESAYLMATLIEQDVHNGAINTERLAPLFRSLYAKQFSARIFGVHKTRVELRAYVTDRQGQVLFHSLGGEYYGDYSRWRDVKLALRGEYGARITPDVEGEPLTSVMYASAPIRAYNGGDGEIVGSVTVGKPVQSFGQFVSAAREKTLVAGLISALAVLVLALIVSVWLVRPFGLIADYIAYVRKQRSLSLPRLGRRALAVMAAAYDEMRDALAGRNYVADYVQTLTHEVKSPLSAIRGAAELLQEPMPPAQQQRFVGNILRETQRIQEMVDRMMELTVLESRRVLDQTEPVALGALLEDALGSAQTAADTRHITLRLDAPVDASVEGDAFLLRRAVGNLIDNAIDFAPAGSVVQVTLQRDPRTARISVRDHGPGIPGYARDKVFEKFYSLARPHSKKKSTGLGLAFVKEIAALHHGRIELGNATGQGALATLSLPVVPGD